MTHQYQLNLKEIGERIQDARQRKKLKRLELANEAGIAYSYLSQIELGAKVPSIDVLLRLCTVLEQPLDYIVTGKSLPELNHAYGKPSIIDNPALIDEIFQIFCRANTDAIKLLLQSLDSLKA